MLNETKLVELFNQVESVVQPWNVSHEPMINWKGTLRKCLSEDVFNALEQLASVAGIPNDEIHAGATRLVMKVDDFAQAWLTWTDNSQAGADVSPAGSPELWSAYETIRANLVAPQFSKPEPIEQLARRELVPAWQIAKIYGWDNLAWVQEELDNPGTHYDPEKWVHPAKAAMDKDIAAAWSKRKPLNMPTVDLPESKPAKPPIAPESLETLIQQRVSVEQIARMKQITVSEVEQAAAMMGVVLAGARFVRPVTPDGIAQEKLADEKQREENFEREQRQKMAEAAKKAEKEANKAKATAVKRVKELRTAGKTPAEMQEVLRAEFPSLDVSQLA